MQFVDTNVFIRYLTKDDPDKAQACFELFRQAQANEVVLTTTEAVITEVVYVLSSKKTYGLARTDIRAGSIRSCRSLGYGSRTGRPICGPWISMPPTPLILRTP